MNNLRKTLSILLVIVLSAVVSGCCAKKKPPASEPGPKRVVQAPVVVEKPEAPPVIKEEPLWDQARKAGALQNIYFDFDKYSLKPDAIQKLDNTGAWLSGKPGVKIRIEGHCDERGTNEYNLALGDRRANSAKDFLIALGVASNRIDIVGYGEEKPQCVEQTEECWAKNRRVHFVVLR